MSDKHWILLNFCFQTQMQIKNRQAHKKTANKSLAQVERTIKYRLKIKLIETTKNSLTALKNQQILLMCDKLWIILGYQQIY